MLSATDFYQATPLLLTVLWIEAVIYLSIGIYEIFDDNARSTWLHYSNVKTRILVTNYNVCVLQPSRQT